MVHGGVRPCQWMRVSSDVSLRRRTLKSEPASKMRPGRSLRSTSPKTLAALPFTSRVLLPMMRSTGVEFASALDELMMGETAAAPAARVFRN